MKQLIVFCIASCLSTVVYSQQASDYRNAAEQGDAAAQYNLGRCYANGYGVTKDTTQAEYWIRKAADQEYATALGFCYNKGYGVTKDYTQAVYWWRKAAEQGEAVAQRYLGTCYRNGVGVTKDYTQAVEWYSKAAEQGDAYSQYNLGFCYYHGDGVTKDNSQAVYWYRKAAEQGDVYSQYNLGFCYYKGEGVTKDNTQAVDWFRKAAEQGYAQAQCELGLCYYYGNGVNKDSNTALYWYNKALINEDGSLSESQINELKLVINSLKGQENSSNAQSIFFPTKVGSVLTYQLKDENDKVKKYSKCTIVNVNGSENDMDIFYTIEIMDAKKRPLGSPIGSKVTIKNGVTFIDMIPQLYASSFYIAPRYAVDINSVYGMPMELSANLQPGQTINDSKYTINMSGENIFETIETSTATNGRCETIENVTVPAGTFKCYKITQNLSTALSFSASMLNWSLTSSSVSWYAPGIGYVKNEQYDRHGKLKMCMELVGKN